MGWNLCVCVCVCVCVFGGLSNTHSQSCRMVMNDRWKESLA